MAQPKPSRPVPRRRSPAKPAPDELVSPQVTPQGQVTFQLHAPNAKSVSLGPIGDLAALGIGVGKPFRKRSNGVWDLSLQRVPPGSYRYHFSVDGLNGLDPRNPATSESNEHAWSLFHVPGAAWMDRQSVPAGSVATVPYPSAVRGRFRRLHVYTPPGYDTGRGRYPVLYLLHGAYDSDHSWSSVGRAPVILDNLIAQGKAQPMIVVMPHGHVGSFKLGMPMWGAFEPELLEDILPFVESRYRIQRRRESRAVAGLSMGGGHALRVGFDRPDLFGHVAVFSSGIFGPNGLPDENRKALTDFQHQHRESLAATGSRRRFPEFWFATGKRDFLLEVTRSTVGFLREHGFATTYHETEGGHTWDRWREYLHHYLPLLFQGS